MAFEYVERNELQHGLMGRGEDHWSGHAVSMCPEPIGRRDTPPVAGPQARKVELRHGGDQVVADRCLVIEEFTGHDGTDGVASDVTGAGL